MLILANFVEKVIFIEINFANCFMHIVNNSTGGIQEEKQVLDETFGNALPDNASYFVRRNRW